MLKVCLKQYLKDKWNMAILLMALIGQIVFVDQYIMVIATKQLYEWRIEIFRYTMGTCKVSFMVFLVISYRYMKKGNYAGVKDIVETVKNGKIKIVSMQMIVLLSANLLYTMVLWLNNVFAAYYLECGFWEYYMLMAKAFLLYIFLFSVMGIVMGAVAAFSRNEYWGYTILGLFLLLFCSQITNIMKFFSTGRESLLYYIAELVQTYARSVNAIPDYEYIIALEPVNWWKTIFWILLFGGILLIQIVRKNKWAAVGVIIIVCADLCLYNHSGMTYYAWEVGDYYDSMNVGREYYSMDNTYEILSETVGNQYFEVNQMILDIETDGELKVKAQINLKADERDKYYFTLVHSYEIDAVTDEAGNDLKYERMSDYICIDNDGKINNIVIAYHGNNELHLVNSAIVDLTPNFAWYPQAGIQRVYDRGLRCYSREVQDELIDFYVTIKSQQKIFSNLKTVEENTFQGKAQGCLLFSGICMAETYIDESRIVYPKLGYREEDIANCFYELKNTYAMNGYDLDGKDWYLIPQFGVMEVYGAFFMDDCIVGSFDGLMLRAENQEDLGEVPYERN